MIRTRICLAIVYCSASLGLFVGCDSKSAQPNPDLKVPDVPPGGKGSKDKGMVDPNAKKK